MADNYYAQKLNSQKLHQVYQTDIDRVKQYFVAEIDFVRQGLRGDEKLLEVGAGYGRILKELAPSAAELVGIDISVDSVELGKEYLCEYPHCRMLAMDAHDLQFGAEFDVVLCLQNGLSAMKGKADNIVAQCMKVLAVGGKAYFSTYSPNFWEHRLAWFHEQANKGLLGEIDVKETRDGIIKCKDGFTAITFTASELEELAQKSGYDYFVTEIDESSIFLVITKDK